MWKSFGRNALSFADAPLASLSNDALFGCPSWIVFKQGSKAKGAPCVGPAGPKARRGVHGRRAVLPSKEDSTSKEPDFTFKLPLAKMSAPTGIQVTLIWQLARGAKACGQPLEVTLKPDFAVAPALIPLSD